MAKLEHSEQKEFKKRRGRELKGTTYEMKNHYPKEIQDMQKKLLPFLKQFQEKGKSVMSWVGDPVF